MLLHEEMTGALPMVDQSNEFLLPISRKRLHIWTIRMSFFVYAFVTYG